MKAYFSALIDVSTPIENSKLGKKLLKDFTPLKTSPSTLNLKEHNAFLFLAVDTPLATSVDSKILAELQSTIQLHLHEYYVKHTSQLQKKLTHQRELQETSQIMKTFLKEIDVDLEKVFDLRLKKEISELPPTVCALQTKSLTAIWNFDEEQKLQLHLSGWTPSVLHVAAVNTARNLELMVDKLAFLNFFCIFLEPTLLRLREMNKVLDRLNLGFLGTHFRSSNVKVQAKLEMFLRILSAKLSSLQNLDKTVLSLFKLFTEPQTFFQKSDIVALSRDLPIVVEQVSRKIDQGQTLLLEVQEKLDACQIQLTEYLDETKNGVKTSSTDDFKLVFRTMAELSSDLFIDAELLKVWLDFFAFDLPFFTFQSSLFTLPVPQVFDTSVDHLLSVRSLVKNYRLGQTIVYALRGVDLDIKDGEFVAIIGNSGAGKTTLLNCMAGLDEPDSGVVFFKGKDLHHASDSEKSKARLLEMGFIFQNYALLPHFDTRENVALPADLAGFSQDLKNRIEELLDGVGLSKQAKQYPAQLSGGQLQRVAIARALTNRPRVLFADEPTGDLDSETGQQVMELLRQFHKDTQTTIIIITHEPDIARYAQRQIKIDDGLIQN